MTGMQWDERQYAELTKERELTPYEAYRIGRDTPAPYVEPQKPAAPAAPKPVTSIVADLAKPVLAVTAVGSVVYVIVSTAAMAVGAVMAFVSANAVAVGGGIFAVSSLAIFFSGLGANRQANSPKSEAGKIINIHVNVGGENVTVNKQ